MRRQRDPIELTTPEEPAPDVPTYAKHPIAPPRQDRPPVIPHRPDIPPGRSRSHSTEVPSHRRSVFSYSPPSSTQSVWEQYYYYPSPDQPVTPGHAIRESYLESGESPALGMRRQRDPIELTTPQEPAPDVPTYAKHPIASPRQDRPPVIPPRPDIPPGRSRSHSTEVPSHRRSVFSYSPPSSTQSVWEQYYYYPSPDQPVTPGHAIRESYLESGESPALGMRRQRDPIELTTPEEPASDVSTYAKHPIAPPRQDRPPVIPPRPDIPPGRNRSHSPQVPSHRRSVFSYSPPSSTQSVWEQYYYYPTPDQPVTPGHAIRESFLESGESPALGIKRKRHSVETSTSQVPPPARESPPQKTRASYPSETMSAYDPNRTQSSIIRRLSFSPPSPSSPGVSKTKKKELYMTSPTGQETKRKELYMTSPPVQETKRKELYMTSPTGQETKRKELYMTSPTGQEKKRKELYMTSPPGQDIPQQSTRKLLRYPYEEMLALDSTLSPSPSKLGYRSFSMPSETKKKELYMASPPLVLVPTAGRRRLSYHNPSPEAEESQLPSPPPPSPQPLSTPPPPSPPSPPSPPLPPPIPRLNEKSLPRRPEPQPRERKRTPSVREDKSTSPDEEGRIPWISCCSIKAEFARRKSQVVPTSTPVESQVRFGVKSLSPIPNSDASFEHYDELGSPSIYGDQHSVRDFDVSSHYKHNRSFLGSTRSPTSFSSPSPLTPRGRSRSVDSDTSADSRLPTPPTSAQLYVIDPSIQHRVILPSKRAPRRGVGDVDRLTRHTFNRFVNDQQMAVVMFYNSKINPPGIEKNWGEHSLKGPVGVDPAFGSVDCAREQELCTREKILSHPFFKLYVKGSLVSAVKDFGLMNYP